jgi:uncharacterized SAM-binding protein YcdF (DUF218 family)
MFSILTSLGSNIIIWLWIFIALCIWAATRKGRSYRRWGFFCLIGFWLICTRPVADEVLKPLESCYTPYDIQSLKKEDIRQVVVLTGGGYPVSGEILSSAFPHGSVYRFLGGIELCTRLGPDCRIIFSGSAGRQRRNLTTAETMKELSLVLNPEREVLAECQSGSTAEHPANVRPMLQEKPFLLVTSAVHMPRTMRTFQKAGLKPIAYPVDFLATSGRYGWESWIPSAENLWKTNVALREYLALTFYTLKGW